MNRKVCRPLGEENSIKVRILQKKEMAKKGKHKKWGEIQALTLVRKITIALLRFYETTRQST